jgi:hypothetical protein
MRLDGKSSLTRSRFVVFLSGNSLLLESVGVARVSENNCQFVKGRRRINALVCTYRVHPFIFLAQCFKSIKQDEETPTQWFRKTTYFSLYRPMLWLGSTLGFGTKNKKGDFLPCLCRLIFPSVQEPFCLCGWQAGCERSGTVRLKQCHHTSLAINSLRLQYMTTHSMHSRIISAIHVCLTNATYLVF